MTSSQGANHSDRRALARQIMESARGQWRQIHSRFGISDEYLVPSKTGMPCPFPGCPGGPGRDRYSPFSDYDQSGGVVCRKCHDGGTEPRCGNGIATLARFLGISYRETIERLADHLGLNPGTAREVRPQEPVSIIRQVAADKRMPLDAFLQFEPIEEVRGRQKTPVARVPVYNERGEKHSYFDLAPGQKGWFARGTGMSGLFMPGRLPKAGETWVVPEGIKDAAALTGLGYNACGLPTNFLHTRYARLFTGVHVIVVPDLDQAGTVGAQKTAGNLFGIATSVRIARLPGQHCDSGGDDVRDSLRKHGESAVREVIENAEAWEPPKGESGPGNEMPTVTLTLAFAWHVDQVVGHLGQLGWNSPWIPASKAESRKLYQRGGLLTEVVDEVRVSADGSDAATATARMRALPLQQLPLRITDACRLKTVRETEDGVIQEDVPPPRWLVDGVYTLGGYGDRIRPLDGVVTAPTIRADGSILQTPGWDAKTALLFRPSMKFNPIPEEPTQADALRAAEKLLEVVSDFPFAGDADRAAWITMGLSMIGRSCVVGHVPMFAITANIRGAGKSLLVDVASLIAFGHTAARTAYAADDDEMRKRITAEAIAGTPAILLDNIDRPVGGASLDAALTAERWKDRELGQSRSVDLPLRAVWACTGNNLAFRSDVARRVIPIRLDSPHERPEERSDFKHDDLLAWTRSQRASLVTAALTILRAYYVAGCPLQPSGQFGSFENWSRIIRGAVLWSGIGDPLETRQTANADDEASALVRGLIGGLREVDANGAGMTCREVVEAMQDAANADQFPVLREVVAEVATSRGLPDGRKLGYAFRRYRGRVAGGYRLLARDGHGGTNRWYVAQVDGGDGGDGGDPPTAPRAPNNCVLPTTAADTQSPAIADVPTTSPPSPPSPPAPGSAASGTEQRVKNGRIVI